MDISLVLQFPCQEIKELDEKFVTNFLLSPDSNNLLLLQELVKSKIKDSETLEEAIAALVELRKLEWDNVTYKKTYILFLIDRASFDFYNNLAKLVSEFNFYLPCEAISSGINVQYITEDTYFTTGDPEEFGIYTEIIKVIDHDFEPDL